MQWPTLIERKTMPREIHDTNQPLADNDRVRQRLTRISHHFLSDTTPTGESESLETHDIFVFNRRPQLPLISVAEIIAQRGYRVEISYPDGLATSLTPFQADHTVSIFQPVTLRFRIINSRDFAMLNARSTLLLAMPTSLDDLRETYILLKQHQYQLQHSVIGITIISAQSRTHAERWYQALRLAAKRYLKLELTSYTAISKNDDSADSVSALHDLATLITNDIEIIENKYNHRERLPQ